VVAGGERHPALVEVILRRHAGGRLMTAAPPPKR